MTMKVTPQTMPQRTPGMPPRSRGARAAAQRDAAAVPRLLHNDDVNAMGHIVRALLASVPELGTERAMEIMIEAHLRGRAHVIACPLERAELYRDRLESFGLTATIERV